MDFNAEERRRKNIADNKRILAEIGLVNPFKGTPKLVFKTSGLKRKAENELPRQRKRPLLEENIDHSNRGSVMGTRRRSARLQGDSSCEGSQFSQLDDGDDEEEVENKRVEKNRPNHYGAIPGVEVGASWYTRMECCRDGIHRPTVAGIHAGAEGAYSIALSGGYDDNVDYGECFTYTGEGGRDLKGTKANPKNLRTAPQSKNQTLTRGNLALSRNVETGNPVRVIRGYKLTSAFAPDEGYRYDGLYTVEKAWYTGGTSGFMVWKFALKRCKDQSPSPWEFAEEFNSPEKSREISNEVYLDKENCNLDKKAEKTGDTNDDEDGETSEGSPAVKPLQANKNNVNEEMSSDKADENGETEDKINSSDNEIAKVSEDQEGEKTGNGMEENEKPCKDVAEIQTEDAVDEKEQQKDEEQQHVASDDGEVEKSKSNSQENENSGEDIAHSEIEDPANEKDQQKSEEEENEANGEPKKVEISLQENDKLE